MSRQKKLEDVVAANMLDTFFTIHVPSIEEPLYISETVQQSINIDFVFFNMEVWGPKVTRSAELTIKVWAKPEKREHFLLLSEVKVHLGSLDFLCKSVGWSSSTPKLSGN